MATKQIRLAKRVAVAVSGFFVGGMCLIKKCEIFLVKIQ
jgi:hypothetical protein